jgi:molybdopterin-guanine dinucleotide biosynthesis protein A
MQINHQGLYPMTGIILAGGKNRRIGTNKAFLVVNGDRIIDRTVGILKSLFEDVIIVANDPLAYLDQNVTIVTDILPDKGALGGLYTGLFFASHSRAFVCACDMPFIAKKFIEYMINQVGSYDIVTPDAGDGWQPMHAIYDKKFLPEMKSMLDQDKLKISYLYKSGRTLTIRGDITDTFDPEKKMFLNVNTYDDLQAISREV